MPFYDHKCLDCGEISNHLYSISKNPKEIECPKCKSTNTERLIGKVHVGWERKIYNTLVKADDERSEAQGKDHMGPMGGYSHLPGEEQ